MKDTQVRYVSEENRNLIILLTSFTIAHPGKGFGLPFMHNEGIIRILAPGPGEMVCEPIYLKMVDREILYWCALMDQHPGEGPALKIDDVTLWPKRYSSWAEFRLYELEPT